MSIDNIIDLRHTPALADNAERIVEAAADIIADLFEKGVEPETILLTEHQHELLREHVHFAGYFDRMFLEHRTEPPKLSCDQLFGVPVEVLTDIYPYLIGGPAHGKPLPKIPVTGGPLRVPMPYYRRRRRPDPCGGYIDYGYRELEYLQMHTNFGPGEHLTFYTCCKDYGTALSLLAREMRRAAARETRR